MPYDTATLARLMRNEADPGNRHRVLTILEYLDIQPGDRVLDCGCGLGWFLAVAGTLYDCALFGADVDPDRLARAAREVSPRSHLTVASAGRLPFREGTFEKVVLSEVLEHVADDAGVMREVWRVLAPGGLVAITVPHRRFPLLYDPINWSRERLGLAPIRQGAFGGIWTNHLRLYERGDLVDLVSGADLSVEDMRPLVHYCLPFAHNLVYGLGKPLVESGLLASADRFRHADNEGSRLNPLNWALGVVNAIDRFDQARPRPEGTSVCLGLKARKIGDSPR